MANEVMTLPEAAELLKVSERTLWEQARENQVPSFKVGKQYRFLRSGLLVWAEAKSKEGDE